MRRCFAVLLVLMLCGAPMAAEAETAEPNAHRLTRFFFSRWGEMQPQTREVLWEGDGCTIRENQGEPRPFPTELAAELEQAVADWGMEGWSGVYSAEHEVQDGESFSLEMEFADGAIVTASGDNAFPARYSNATDALEAIFEREKMGAIAGTYQYEGEGFGGEFTITLEADGAYSFSEGVLSSYTGAGTWHTAHDAVYMSEGDAGFDLSFMFRVEGNALIYLSDGSDAFPYVDLPDEARFTRLSLEVNSMKLYIGETQVPVVWEENGSVEALRALLPLTIPMSMYGGFEQVGPIGQSVVRDDRQTTTQSGDIVLYSGNQIVIFYGSNSWAYTRLGHIDLSEREMRDLLSGGDVTITIQ